MSTPLAEMFEHNRWANLLLIDSCESLTEEQLGSSSTGGFGTILSTLHHILAAEERYVGRLSGLEPASSINVEAVPTFPQMKTAAEWTGSTLLKIASEEGPGRILKTNFAGIDWELTASVVLAQAIHHANEHRAQIAATLTTIGIEPPDVSSWAWADATGKMRRL